MCELSILHTKYDLPNVVNIQIGLVQCFMFCSHPKTFHIEVITLVTPLMCSTTFRFWNKSVILRLQTKASSKPPHRRQSWLTSLWHWPWRLRRLLSRPWWKLHIGQIRQIRCRTERTPSFPQPHHFTTRTSIPPQPKRSLTTFFFRLLSWGALQLTLNWF